MSVKSEAEVPLSTGDVLRQMGLKYLKNYLKKYRHGEKSRMYRLVQWEVDNWDAITRWEQIQKELNSEPDKKG
jgi:hypothetical protein